MSTKKPTKTTTAKNTPRTRCVPSVATAKPTSRPQAEKAPTPAADANVANVPSREERLADIYTVGGEVESRLTALNEEVLRLNDVLADYHGKVSDKGVPLTDSEMGTRDMTITSKSTELALTTTAMLLTLLCGRQARCLAIAGDDLLRLNELARKAWSAFVTGTAKTVLLADADAA